MKNNYICISEHQYIINNKYLHGNRLPSLNEFDFTELEYLIVNSSKEDNYDEIFKIEYKKLYEKVIKVNGYVGIIQLSSGTIIEILPMVYKAGNEEICRKLVLLMLKEMRNISFKQGGWADLCWSKMNLYDIFIVLFLKELQDLISKGLKSTYNEIEVNSTVFKGILEVKEQIRQNMIHKERFYVKYDEYNRDRVENKIIKSTLIYLYNKTMNNNIKIKIKKIISELEDITESKDIDTDLKKCMIYIDMVEYKNIIEWCAIFLRGNCFINKRGRNNTKTILFNMEELFKKYVNKQISKSKYFHEYNIKFNFGSKYLIEVPSKNYKLIGDIFLENNKSRCIINVQWAKICDIKYIFSTICKSTLNDIYSYCKKYMCTNGVLLYPYLDKELKPMTYFFEDKIKLTIVFIDIFNIEKSLSNLVNEVQ